MDYRGSLISEDAKKYLINQLKENEEMFGMTKSGLFEKQAGYLIEIMKVLGIYDEGLVKESGNE